MIKTILVPTDGSTQVDKALKTAIELARQLDGRIIGLAVVEPYPFPPIAESPYTGGSEAYEQRALELGTEHVQKIAAAAAAAQVPCETVVAQAMEPHEEIVETASRYKCDAILMATHGRRGLSKLFAGSQTQKVIANASVPVIVIR